MLRHSVLETSVYTPLDLLRWRPAADRCIVLASLLGPGNPCPVTTAAACDALAAAVRLGALLSAPVPPPTLATAARELLTRPSAALYGSEAARVAAVGLLWTLGEERSVAVSQLEGYDPLQRHMQLMGEKLGLESTGGERANQPDRLSPVARPTPVPDLAATQTTERPRTTETLEGGTDRSGEDTWLAETAAALRRILSDPERPLPAPCLETMLEVLTKMGPAAADWDGTVCDVVIRLATAAREAQERMETDAEMDTELETEVETETEMGTERVTVTVEETGTRTETKTETNPETERHASDEEPGMNHASAQEAATDQDTGTEGESELGPASPEVAALYRAATSHEHVRAAFIRLAAGVLDRLSPQIQVRSGRVSHSVILCLHFGNISYANGRVAIVFGNNKFWFHQTQTSCWC